MEEKNRPDDILGEAEQILRETKSIPVVLQRDIADDIHEQLNIVYQTHEAIRKISKREVTLEEEEEQFRMNLLRTKFWTALGGKLQDRPGELSSEVSVPLSEEDIDFLNETLKKSMQSWRDYGTEEELLEERVHTPEAPEGEGFRDYNLRQFSLVQRAFLVLNRAFVKAGGEERPVFTNFKNPPPNR